MSPLSHLTAGASGEERTHRTDRIVGRRLHARVVRAVQPNVVMLQRVQLRALLHEHEQQREQNGDNGAAATCHRNRNARQMTGGL